jgi:hypothetical protein
MHFTAKDFVFEFHDFIVKPEHHKSWDPQTNEGSHRRFPIGG